MVDPEGDGAVDALRLQVEAISASGWPNIQVPVKEALEAAATTASRLFLYTPSIAQMLWGTQHPTPVMGVPSFHLL